MNRDRVLTDYDFQTPRRPVTVRLSLDPDEIEMAMATNGSSLRGPIMRAIIFALVLDGGGSARNL